MSKGKLIVVEGLDGSGKGTQSKLIQEYLKNKNLRYTYFHFPMYGHNQFSDIISRFLRGEFGDNEQVDPLFVANIYAMDRFRFLPQLEEALKNNDVVLLDRYVYSNIAYQCAKYKEQEEVERMKDWIFDFEFNFLKLPYPDLNILLDVPIDIIKERLEEERTGDDREYLNGKYDIHEASIEFQKNVRDNYKKYMEGSVNCKIIPCACQLGKAEERQWFTLPPETIFELYEKYLNFILFDIPISYE